MTFLITESCIRCKYMNCFEVCPVDCFFEGENMLVINPDECIDCALCEPECPVEAIIHESADDDGKWLELNTKFSEIWPNIITKGKVDTSVSDSYAEEKGKFEKYFSEKEGKG